MKLNCVWVLIKTGTYQPAVCARWTESELPYRQQTAVIPHPVKHLHGLWFNMIKHCIKWNKSYCLADKPCSTYHTPALLHSLTAACYVVWKKSAGRTGKGFSLIKQWLDIQLRSFKTTTIIVKRPDSGELLATAEWTCHELGATSPTGPLAIRLH